MASNTFRCPIALCGKYFDMEDKLDHHIKEHGNATLQLINHAATVEAGRPASAESCKQDQEKTRNLTLGNKTGRANYVLSSPENEKKVAENFKAPKSYSQTIVESSSSAVSSLFTSEQYQHQTNQYASASPRTPKGIERPWSEQNEGSRKDWDWDWHYGDASSDVGSVKCSGCPGDNEESEDGHYTFCPFWGI